MTTGTRPMDDGKPPPSSRKRVQEGMALMIVAMLVMPGIDAIAKLLSASVSTGQITWGRFLFQSIILIPLVIHSGGLLVGRVIWGHVARGVLLAGATLMFFASLRVLPLADAISIFFVEPFLLTILSVLLLRERVGWRRLLAIAIGFSGALIVVRPSYAVFGLPSLFPLGAALCFAFYMIITRLLAHGNASVIQFYTGVFGFVTMSCAMLAGDSAGWAVLTFSWLEPVEWALLALLGAIATFGHLMIVLAVRRIGAGLAAPFQYLEIISATLLGFVFFGDFPDQVTWTGIAIIIGSGLYVFYRERLQAIREDDALVGLKP